LGFDIWEGRTGILAGLFADNRTISVKAEIRHKKRTVSLFMEMIINRNLISKIYI